MTLPEPSQYTDGVLFFHDMHKVVLHECAELEALLSDAEKNGVFASFSAKPEWKDVFAFFQKAAPIHERDEERFLFPLVIQRVPRMGFQQPDAPIHFLLEGHDIMQKGLEKLVMAWDAFLKKREEGKTSDPQKHAAEDAAFIAQGRELASLYRDHVAVEEQRVYSVAEKVLTGSDKLALRDALVDAHDNEAIMPVMQFETPVFTNSQYNITYDPTEAVSDAEFETEEDEDEEE